MVEFNSYRWFEIGINIDLNNLQEYIDTIERSLVDQKKEFEKQVDRQAAEIDEDIRDEFYEYHSDEHWRLSDVFPSMLRSTVFVASYSLLENHLVDICEREHSKQKLGKAPKLKSGIIFKARDYLVDVAGIKLPDSTPAWDNICAYNKLRNAIVHKSGKLDDELKKELEDFLKASPGISLDQNNALQFTEEFCPEVIKNMKDFFFKELIPALSD
jgi:hypothetical protein